MRERQDSVFERDYVSTLTRGTQHSLRSLIHHCINLMENTGYRLYIQFPSRLRVSSRHDGIRSAPSCTMSRYTKDISRNRVHQAYSAEGFFQGHFKTHDSEVGFEPTLIVLKTIELTIFLFQIIAVCVFFFGKEERYECWSK